MGRKKVSKEFDDLPEDERPVFPISVVAQMFNIHQQSLRMYEREELLAPKRTKGGTRLYSRRDLQQLETIMNLSQELGVNLAGIEIILRLRKDLDQTMKIKDRALMELERLLNLIRDKYNIDYDIDLKEELPSEPSAIVQVSKRDITRSKR